MTAGVVVLVGGGGGRSSIFGGGGAQHAPYLSQSASAPSTSAAGSGLGQKQLASLSHASLGPGAGPGAPQRRRRSCRSSSTARRAARSGAARGSLGGWPGGAEAPGQPADDFRVDNGPLRPTVLAKHWTAMLRGEEVKDSRQVKSFATKRDELPWSEKDERLAIEYRHRAYAEAAAAKAADDAVAAYEAELADGAQREERREARRRAPPRAGQSPAAPPSPAAGARAEADDWDAILNEDVEGREGETFEKVYFPTEHYVAKSTLEPASPKHSPPKNASPPGPKALSAQSARQRRKKARTDKFLKQAAPKPNLQPDFNQAARAHRDLGKLPRPSDDHSGALRGHEKLLDSYTTALLPPFDEDGQVKSPARPRVRPRAAQAPRAVLRGAGQEAAPGRRRGYDESWLEDRFANLMGGGAAPAVPPLVVGDDDQTEEHPSPLRDDDDALDRGLDALRKRAAADAGRRRVAPPVAPPEPEPEPAAPEAPGGLRARAEPVVAPPEPEPVVAPPEPEPVVAPPEPEPAPALAPPEPAAAVPSPPPEPDDAAVGPSSTRRSTRPTTTATTGDEGEEDDDDDVFFDDD
ncbi:hypothetical protein JL722_15151 [Aureococcus anophagefferens]|nr:hypothetical protein JL722_15151 [Aureococcus anophagefferens]